MCSSKVRWFETNVSVPFSQVFSSIDEDGAGGKGKRLSIEKIYQKKSQLEHILLRPDTYIGSVEKHTTQMWVYDTDQEGESWSWG